MIFHEIYGNYYHTVAEILDAALKEEISDKTIWKIVKEKAFAESSLTIPKELSEKGKWPLLNEEKRAVIHRKTSMPLTIMEKRWLKALLADPRIALFQPEQTGLEDVEPLFRPKDIVLFDQFADGDPYGDETYTKLFRQILSAVKKKNSIRVLYPLKNGTEKWIKCNPVRLEYSLRDDKFRLISVYKGRINTISVSKIIQCETIGSFRTAKIKEEVHDKRTVELLVKDERQALERVMMQFSIYQKATERIEENSYRITLTYEAEDEIDLMIQILSFGTSLKVAGPEAFVEQIKNRLEMQKRCGH